MGMPTIQNLPQRAQELIKNPDVSDGCELIPAEVKSRIERMDHDVPHLPYLETESQGESDFKSPEGYTTDQEGLINNYPVTPNVYVQNKARFGFTKTAELLNGRAAMLGFIALLLTEWLAGRSLISILMAS